MKNRLFFLPILLLVQPVFAQTERIEIPAKLYTEKFQVTLLGEKGLIVFEQKESDKECIFKKYDTGMKEEWTVSVKLKTGALYQSHSLFRESLYCLYKQYASNSFELIRIQCDTGNYELFDFKLVNNLTLKYFKAQENDLYLAGNSGNMPVLVLHNLTTHKNKALPVDFQNKGEVVELELDTLNNFINLTLALKWPPKEKKLWIKSFYKGREVGKIELTSEKDKELVTGSVRRVNKRQNLVTGLYNLDPGGRSVQGVYTALADSAGKVDFLRYHDFSQYKNFFNYLPEKQKKTTLRSVDKLRVKNKPYQLKNQIYPQEVLRVADHFLLLCGSYFMEIRGQIPGNRASLPIFDGWQFEQIVVTALNEKGEFLWDQALATPEMRLTELQDFAQVADLGDSLLFAYADNDSVYQQVVLKDSTLQKRKGKTLETGNEEEKIKENYSIRLKHWYGRYFLLFGYQRISGRENRRQVFFVQKMYL